MASFSLDDNADVVSLQLTQMQQVACPGWMRSLMQGKCAQLFAVAAFASLFPQDRESGLRCAVCKLREYVADAMQVADNRRLTG
jgi:hypothetical protein